MRSWLKRIPRQRHIRGTWLHRRLGDRVFDPELWRPNRHSVALAMAWGALWAMVPIPFQSIPAAICSYMTRANIPASVAAVWITNPFTTPFFVYLQYKLGAWVMGVATIAPPGEDSLWAEVKAMPLPFAVGCLITMVLIPPLVYAGVSLLWTKVALVWWRKHGQVPPKPAPEA